MSPLELAAPVGAVVGHMHVARWIAAVVFVGLLLTLGLGLLRVKRQVLHDEAEAALEADFARLERELGPGDPSGPAQPRGEEGS